MKVFLIRFWGAADELGDVDEDFGEKRASENSQKLNKSNN